jgi:hypothetical protein
MLYFGGDDEELGVIKSMLIKKEENNLSDVTLTGEKNCCFRPTTSHYNISGTCHPRKQHEHN